MNANEFLVTALTSLDSYKLGHAKMYPEGTSRVYSNMTPRSMHHFRVSDKYKADNTIVWLGAQSLMYEINKIFKETFFNRDEDEVVNDFVDLVTPFVGPNGFDATSIRNLHKLGYLPLKVKALPEGSRVPIGVPVITIVNTVSEFYWLTNFLETWISAELWKMSTSATTASVYRRIIENYAELTGGSKEFVDWQGHDFSVRGMSGILDAAKSGVGHLLSFLGTDNIPAVQYARVVYRGKETFIGGSVPASEHSVMAAGTKENELETYRRMLKMYPSGVISLVSDTYDFFNVITNYARILKEEILNRTPDAIGLAKTVFRPDSGDPVDIICGDPEAPVGSNEYKGAVECLYDLFGGTLNAKGYTTLNQRVGLIYGDSITVERCEAILTRLMAKGFASDNIVFGIGSFTYQYVTRDTLGSAMKATYVVVNGVGVEIFKDPVTDNGTKKSAKGLLRVDQVDGRYVLRDQVTPEEESGGCLETMYLDGELLTSPSLAEMRERLASYKV